MALPTFRFPRASGRGRGSIAAIALGSLYGGCAATSLPPAIKSDVSDPLPLRIATDSQGVAAGLERTNVFAAVVCVHDQASTPADLLLTVRTVNPGGGPPIPVVTMLTLGLIPTVVTYQIAWDLTFAPPGRPEEAVTCRYGYQSVTVIGALGTLLSLDVHHYTTESLYAHPRFYDHLERTIREHAPALLAGAGRPNPS